MQIDPMTTPDNQAEREKLADAIDEQLRLIDIDLEHGGVDAGRARVKRYRAEIAASGILRGVARSTDAHRGVAEKIVALPWNDGRSERGCISNSDIPKIVALLASIPGGLVLTAEEAALVAGARKFFADTSLGSDKSLFRHFGKSLLAIITHAAGDTP